MSGGECRGARRKTKEVKKCRAGNQLYTFWTVVKVIDSSSYFGSENGKMRHHWDWTANVADGGKKKFVFLPWKETDILSSKDAPTCISTENVNLFGKFVSAPNHRPPFRIPVLKMFGLVCWWKRPVNCGSSEQKLPFLLCQDTSEGTSFGTEWGEARYYGGVSLSVSVLCATWFLIIADVTLFLDWNSNAKRLCISRWHGEIDKKGLQSTAVVGFGLTCPTSQCGSQPTSAQMSCSCLIKQLFKKKKVKVIPVMDDDAA